LIPELALLLGLCVGAAHAQEAPPTEAPAEDAPAAEEEKTEA
jgi:hypothetical protein